MIQIVGAAVASAALIATGARHLVKERSKHKMFPGVRWYCDGCGERLDKQEGFTDSLGSWRCTNCGHENPISGEHVYKSPEEWLRAKRGDSSVTPMPSYESPQVRLKVKRRERRDTPISYPHNMGQEGFERLVKEEASSIKRIKRVYVDGADVTGIVRSSSGISEWRFTIDFNDYGNLLGEVWIWSENDDSKIPQVLAERVQRRLEKAGA